VTGVGITQTATAITVGGNAIISGGAGVITLNDAGNDFQGTVALSNSGANNVAVTDTNAIVLGTVAVGTGSLTVNAGGSITQSGVTTITQTAAAGVASFTTGGAVIALTNANDFTGAVALANTGANNVAVTDTNAIIMGTTSVGTGSLTVNAGGAITQSGVTTITQAAAAGTASFATGGAAITLTNANDFTGAVGLTNTGANNVAVTDTNAIILGTITVGTGTLIVNAGGAITQNGATTITQTAAAGAASFTTGNANIALTNGNDFTGAVNLTNTGANVVGLTDVNALTLGSITMGGGTVLTANATQIGATTLSVPLNCIAHLYASAAAGVTIATANIAGANSAGDVAANPSNTGAATNARLDVGDSNFQITTLNSTGILQLTGRQTGAHSITGGGSASGIIEYYGTGGTVGTVFNDIMGAPNYYHLRIAGSGLTDTFTLSGNVQTSGDVIIDGGVLVAGADQITVGGYWLNSSGSASFDSGSGTVAFAPNPAYLPTRAIHVTGNNNWWIFYCHADGATILFENGMTQRIVALSPAIHGVFNIQASSFANRIYLSRLSPGSLPPALPDAAGNPATPAPAPTDDSRFWFFDLSPGATLLMDWVDIFYSNARSNPVNIPPGVTWVTPQAGHIRAGYVLPFPYFDFKWLFKLYALFSYTEDTNFNGKIDRIRVTTETGINGDFSNFDIDVEGYTIDRAKGTNGFARAGSGNRTLYIYLVEKPYNDTGATPRWRVLRNFSLKDVSTNSKLFGTLETSLTDFMTPGDTAWPAIGYTLALPSLGQQFIHLSEPVTAGGLAPSGPNLGLAGAPTFTSGSAPGIQEANGPGGAYSSAQLAQLAPPTIGISPTLADMGHAPLWVTPDYDSLVPASDNPIYPPNTGYAGDPDSTLPGNYVQAPDKLDASRPTFDFQRAGASPSVTSHRTSDLLVSVQPSTVAGSWSLANPDSWFVWPIWAKDKVASTLTDAQIEALTPAQTAAQGIGLIRAFDGSQWLRDQNWTMQVRQAATLPAAAPSIAYDSNVSALLVSQVPGVWLPNSNLQETNFSGLAGFPDTGVALNPAPSLSAPPLYNYAFLASDPKVFSVAAFEFYFRLPGASADLYAGRLAIPADAAAIPANWFRLVRPFGLGIHDVALQKGGASILNNVIDPTKGETARLSYQLASAGAVTITVFTLDGDVVARLENSKKAAGDYAVSWNGRNLAGNPVARGVYFVRIVAPGIDEIRKVLVVRK
jgi:fibronectin-binding autotransporter adhesin